MWKSILFLLSDDYVVGFDDDDQKKCDNYVENVEFHRNTDVF